MDFRFRSSLASRFVHLFGGSARFLALLLLVLSFCPTSFAQKIVTTHAGDSIAGLDAIYSINGTLHSNKVVVEFWIHIWGFLSGEPYGLKSVFTLSSASTGAVYGTITTEVTTGTIPYRYNVVTGPTAIVFYGIGVFSGNDYSMHGKAIIEGPPGENCGFSAASGTSGIVGPPDPVTGSDTYVVGTIVRQARGNQGNKGTGLKISQLLSLIGEPVNVTTGEFYEDHVDLQVKGPLPIEIRRSYSSRNAGASNEFGFGWLPGYPSYLVPSADLSTIQAPDTDGSLIVFRRQTGSTTVWSPTLADNPGLAVSPGGPRNMFRSTLVQSTAGDGTVSYRWNLPDGSSRNYVVRSFPITVAAQVISQECPYLTTIIDNRGNTLNFTYCNNPLLNEFGRVTQIDSSNGGSVSLSYNAAGLITLAVAGDGRWVSYIYDGAGDLVRVQLPDGTQTVYEYGDSNGVPNHLLVRATSPDGRVLQNDYDFKGRVAIQRAEVDPARPASLVVNATFNYAVDDNGAIYSTEVTDGNNGCTHYEINHGLITKITDPLGHIVTQTWYGTSSTETGAYPGALHTSTDHRGLVTTYQYDAQGNTTQTQVTGDLVGDPNTTTQTATTTAIYNSLSLPVTTTDATGITTNFSYTDSNYPYLPTQIVTSKGGTTLRTDILTYTARAGSKGLLATKTVASGSPDQAVTTYDYNFAGLVIQQTARTGTSDPDVVTNFTYTPRGELDTATDADGRLTKYTYDGMSRPLTKVVKDEQGNILGTWTTTYTGSGDVASIVGPRTGAIDSVQHTYDGAGRLIEVSAALSQAKTDGSGIAQSSLPATTDYIYDYFGNLVEEIDPIGNVTSMTYDANGQLLVKDTAGLRTERFQYEPGGRVSQYTNPLGGITNTFYTATGQPRRQENPDGAVLQWRYYTDGRLQQAVLRNGSKWTTVYDDVNRTVTRTLTNAAGTVLASEISVYDHRGNLISHTDPEGYVKTTTYDGLNRIKTATGPASIAGSAQQTTTFVYGASAKTLATQNGLGERIVTTSDALGRPQQTQVLNAGGTAIHTTSYTYSADHNAVTVTEGTGAGAVSRTTWTDTRGRPVLTLLGDGSFTSNVYDLDGNLLFSTDALRQTTGYAYNALNQLTVQTLPDGTVTSFTYDAVGNLLTRAMADGTLTQAQTYDSAGRKLTEKLYSGSTTTRQFSYAYYPSGIPAGGLLQTVTTPRDTITTTYDDFLRPQIVTTAGVLAETNTTTTYTYDRRNLVTAINQSSVNNAAGPATLVSRTFDGYGQLLTEVVTAGGSTYASVTQTWDAAGRRASLNEVGSTLPAPLFAYQHRADGLLAQVTANSQNCTFAYADNGLLTGRVNPFRTLSVDMRDAAGRIQGQTQVAGGAAALVEDIFWRANSTLDSYTATRSGAGAWNETRVYAYNDRGQLLTEGFSSAPGASNVFNYAFDGNSPGLGVRLDAKIGTGAPVAWETRATANSLGRVTADNQLNASGRAVPAGGVASGADHVDISVDGISQGRAAYPGGGAWSINLDLAAGAHTLTAKAVDPSGLYTATASSNFTVAGANPNERTGTVTSAFDDDGNVTSRSWISGLTQTLTWDAFGRLIKVAQRNSANNGYDWTAIYDGLGRRLKTAQQPVTANTPSGVAAVTKSIYDPQVEFLEIGVAVNGAKAWKVYGPDLNGRFGGLQGTGGLEAVILDADGTTTGVINDQFGNGVASVSGGSVTWFTTRVGAYGPLPGIQAQTLTDVSQLAAATAWRSRRIDPTGFYWLGARYYEPTSGRFLSADPMGHAASPSLYDFCNGDPVNSFDPDGRLAKGSFNAQSDLVKGLGGLLWNTGGAIGFSFLVKTDPYLAMQVYGDQAMGLVRTGEGIATLVWATGGAMGFNEVARFDPYLAVSIYGDQVKDFIKVANGLTGGEGNSTPYRIAYTATNIAALIGGGELGDAGRAGEIGDASSELGLAADTATLAAPGSRVTLGISEVEAVELEGRLTPVQMAGLQAKYGTEFAQIYLTGPGRNGGGGTYYLIKGDEISVQIPVGPNVRFINHTHPEVLDGGLVPLKASPEDFDVLKALQNAGSPQKTSQIVPEVGVPFTFHK